MDEHDTRNAMIRIEQAKLAARAASGEIDAAAYQRASMAIGMEKARPSMVSNALVALIAGAVLIFALAITLFWVLGLFVIAPGALLVAFASHSLALRPPMWLTYAISICISAGVYYTLIKIRGAKTKALTTYLLACLAIFWLFLGGATVQAAWTKTYFGFFNGQRNGSWDALWARGLEVAGASAVREVHIPERLGNDSSVNLSPEAAPQASAAPASDPVGSAPATDPKTPSTAPDTKSAEVETQVPEAKDEKAPTAGPAEVQSMLEVRPSFDCVKARTFHERRVCANQSLAKLDLELAAQYQKAFAEARVPHMIKLDQGSWWRGLAKCTDDACLEREYEIRLKQLKTSVQQQ